MDARDAVRPWIRLRRALAALHPKTLSMEGDSAAHTMTGAYACDALSSTDRLAVHAHLRSCAGCTEEVMAFSAVAAKLADAVALAPPARLYPHVIFEITGSRQAPTRGARRPRSAERRP